MLIWQHLAQLRAPVVIVLYIIYKVLPAYTLRHQDDENRQTNWKGSYIMVPSFSDS